MSAQVEGTNDNGENEFVQWLRSLGVKLKMIQKLTQEIGSVKELSQIPDNEDEISSISEELNLTAIQKNKLRYIIGQAKSEQFDTMNVLSTEESKALLKMKKKMEEIEKAMQNIGKIQKDIDNEVVNWTKQIEATFFDVNTALNKRKTELIQKLNKIATEYKNKLNNKNKELNQQYSESKKKSNHCRSLLGKSVQLEQIESRKNVVLNLSKEVNNVNIPCINNDKYTINVSINKNDLIKIVKDFGHINSISVPIPVLLSIDYSKNPIKLKWKLKDFNAQNDNQKIIKVEWTKLDNDNKDDDEKEMKLNFDNQKSFDVNNYNNNENEILLNIGHAKGKYIFKLYYFYLNTWSVASNIKSIQYTPQMRFYTEKHGDNLEFNGNIVKKINDSNAWATCLFGEEINDTMCNQFNISIRWKVCKSNQGVVFGYITSGRENGLKNWTDYLGSAADKANSVGFWIYHGYSYFYETTNGKDKKMENYKAASNFKQGDTFKFSFNFVSNKLVIYHNGTKAETVNLLNNCKTFTCAISMYAKDEEVEIINYEFVK